MIAYIFIIEQKSTFRLGIEFNCSDNSIIITPFSPGSLIKHAGFPKLPQTTLEYSFF